jgi:hypothetical protein
MHLHDRSSSPLSYEGGVVSYVICDAMNETPQWFHGCSASLFLGSQGADEFGESIPGDGRPVLGSRLKHPFEILERLEDRSAGQFGLAVLFLEAYRLEKDVSWHRFEFEGVS